ncbi:hypothetical protein [Aporhodopirellula aestuarii]|uniref:Uncharacterized protein n=1 Tax=Aporhodopirellula aestuarii TaxID=2950107 RepID=A0ABT0TZB4_9BACT|nr:hypothetical protein [Aporhodopirellula aestuarii]MCM2369865.1 hypothetical protein [Aporhodopirellula aestuarii]
MNPISSTSASAQTYVTSATSRGQASGGNPAERLEQSLTSYFDEQGVSSDEQTAIKSELSDAITSLKSSASTLSPTEVKESLSEILTNHGLDGEGFVSQLGTPQSGGDQGGQEASEGRGPGGGKGGGPRGAGGPPPRGGARAGGASEGTEESSATLESSDIDDLLEWLDSQTSDSDTETTQSVQTFPESFIKRGGGNLDAQA